MKEIRNYKADKYKNGLFKRSEYRKIEEGIYAIGKGPNPTYVSSISFVQEPEYEEGENAADISQYPMEDILDEYNCWTADFYEELNKESSKTCYHEFAFRALEDARRLQEIIGKHVYNKTVPDEDGEEYVHLVVE